ncbi:prolyl aminopeptidase [Peredibacter starrii]|uniref:Proline iminopeptidase n=1 Tax=Peredibacter starrii TaxID=28202 RepID=A0AAX4HJ24_9BACT|nr:prolyl aminopeptidase [Peredibacter starrii]WPU63225.1 prolyl aminopeptidase [Peredibacter starrii]
MREFYPEIEAYQTGHLQVSDLHSIYYEQVGNPDGKPVVFVHGGPGGGVDPSMRRFFDPKVWRIVLFDQRGCGKSKPFSELKDNTTWDLVSDMEKLRMELNIEKWTVFGGSWGSTLALSYAINHANRVTGLILRGIFLLRKKEIDWFYQDGASYLFPDAWAKYLEPIPEVERHDLVTAFYKRLTSPVKEIRTTAAKAWSIWEGSTSKLFFDPKFVERFGGDEFADAFARIECHYFVNKGFFPEDGWILKNVDKIRHIPAWIVQGRYDVVCPATSAYELNQAWPESKLHIIPDAGHSASEPGIKSKLIEATDFFGTL